MSSRGSVLVLALCLSACATRQAHPQHAADSKRHATGQQAFQTAARPDAKFPPAAEAQASRDRQPGDHAEPGAKEAEPGAKEKAPEPSAESFEALVERSRQLVAELGQQSWTVACAKAAQALGALGAAMQALPEAQAPIRKAAVTVQGEAKALGRSCRASFDVADHMQDGLRTALRGIAEAATGGDARRLEPWLGTAEDAVDALDKETDWVFQQAGVQDAFRTVSDVFVVLNESH